MNFVKYVTVGATLMSLIACNPTTNNPNITNEETNQPILEQITPDQEKSNLSSIFTETDPNRRFPSDEDYRIFLEEYIEKIYDEAVIKQENTFRIKHEPRAQISFGKGLYDAIYYPSEKEIEFRYAYNNIPGHFAKAYSSETANPEKSLELLLHHELGHHLTHIIREKHNLEDPYEILSTIDSEKEPQLFKEKRLKLSLLEEGIAEYISYKIFPKEKDNNVEELVNYEKPNFQDNKHLSAPYLFGHSIVSPALNINFEKGIEFFLKNELTSLDKEYLLDYSQRAVNYVQNN